MRPQRGVALTVSCLYALEPGYQRASSSLTLAVAGFLTIIIITVMYIYCGLINTLSAGMIQINLNTVFCTHVETSPKYSILYTCRDQS